MIEATEMPSTIVQHQPVLLEEAIHYLGIQPEGTYVDCTTGLGGHSEAILQALGGAGKLLSLDRDGEALELARCRLGQGEAVEFFHENYRNLPLLLHRQGIEQVDGILLDLGCSSLQLDTPRRGFSFRKEGPLDMRMDPRSPTRAADLVNQMSEQKLAELFHRFGEERYARRIARAIVARRKIAPLRTTVELASVVAEAQPASRRPRPGRIHPATRVFQALRIAVNQELEGLQDFLHAAIECLCDGGRLVAISFHSLEDRIVKRTFQEASGRCICFRPLPLCQCPRKERVSILTPRPVRARAAQIEQNPRARSARLRALEKLPAFAANQDSRRPSEC